MHRFYRVGFSSGIVRATRRPDEIARDSGKELFRDADRLRDVNAPVQLK